MNEKKNHTPRKPGSHLNPSPQRPNFYGSNSHKTFQCDIIYLDARNFIRTGKQEVCRKDMKNETSTEAEAC